MTNVVKKVAEKVREIYYQTHERSIPMFADIETNEQHDMADKIAHAAIDTLDIIVLPKDAEPRMEDVWTLKEGRYVFHVTIGGHIGLKGDNCVMGFRCGKSEEQLMRVDKLYKCIQRNGQPVIMEG